ncbi:hypothetical protein GA0061101_110168 [Rhizobium lusitanum]|uniref:Uncharacterized protein n=1 Tax=Rhizobium lusitanum TaxID=293958 RepID=A0A1C3WEA2_9HYPH|nr:hypothetical protein GA0061101_110168 [Rhizobium lusitanum]
MEIFVEPVSDGGWCRGKGSGSRFLLRADSSLSGQRSLPGTKFPEEHDVTRDKPCVLPSGGLCSAILGATAYIHRGGADSGPLYGALSRPRGLSNRTSHHARGSPFPKKIILNEEMANSRSAAIRARGSSAPCPAIPPDNARRPLPRSAAPMSAAGSAPDGRAPPDIDRRARRARRGSAPRSRWCGQALPDSEQGNGTLI